MYCHLNKAQEVDHKTNKAKAYGIPRNETKRNETKQIKNLKSYDFFKHLSLYFTKFLALLEKN